MQTKTASARNGSSVVFKLPETPVDYATRVGPSTLQATVRGVSSSTDQARLQRASWAFVTRRVDRHAAVRITPGVGRPKAGDLILARVDGLGHHANLHRPCGRRQHLFVGDEIVVAYGNRYACAQFEARVPETFGPCHLVAGGGMASRAISWHSKITRGPTHITPLGLASREDGRPLNLRDFALSPPHVPKHEYVPTVIAVLGTSMDSGKTQSACYLARGLIGAGLKVGYAKVTGTGAGGDIGWLEDAGADPAVDFTDVGMASTYLQPIEEVQRAMQTLIRHVAGQRVDAIIIEVADGVLQQETSALLQSNVFGENVGGIVLAAQDSMGASAGFNWLKSHCPTPILSLSGVISSAPLQAREAQQATQLEVLNREGLASPENAMALLALAQRQMSQLNMQPQLTGTN